MNRFAFSRGQGPAYADLPPTLQPFAIASAAPHDNHLRAAGLSGLIYLLLGSAIFALSALAPRVPVDILKPTKGDRVIEFDPPTSVPRVQLPPVVSTGQSGVDNASASTPVAPSVVNADALPSNAAPVDRSLDPPPAGHAVKQGNAQTDALIGPAGPTVHDFSMIGLEVLQRVDPIYPDMARRAHVQGTVVLLMTVDEAGVPTQVQVLEGHPALQESASRAARQWRFVPARFDGRTVAASFRLTLKFSLK